MATVKVKLVFRDKFVEIFMVDEDNVVSWEAAPRPLDMRYRLGIIKGLREIIPVLRMSEVDKLEVELEE